MRNNFCRLREPELQKLDPNVPVDLMGMLWSPFHMNERNGYIWVPVDSFQQITNFLTDHAQALAAQPVAVDGMPERMAKPDQRDDEYERGEIKGHNACHDAFTAWLSKAAQGLPEPTAYMLDGAVGGSVLEFQQADLLECQNRYGGDISPLVLLDAVAPVFAERDALRAEVERLSLTVSTYDYTCDAMDRERDTLRTANAKLVGLLLDLRQQNYLALDVEQRIDAILASAGGGDHAQ